MKPSRLTLTLALAATAALLLSAGAAANGSKLILSDPFTQGGQHKTVVESDTFSAGSTIVAVAKLGGFVDGGAPDNGFASALDNRAPWASGVLPGLPPHTNPPGPDDPPTHPPVALGPRPH